MNPRNRITVPRDELETRVRIEQAPNPFCPEGERDNIIYFSVTLDDGLEGYVALQNFRPRLHWNAFYPLSSSERAQERYARQGIGTYVHARIVKHLWDTLPVAEWNVVHEHEFVSTDRQKHLSKMGFDVSGLRTGNVTIDFCEYRERSLAYAERKGFEPYDWQPLEVRE